MPAKAASQDLSSTRPVVRIAAIVRIIHIAFPHDGIDVHVSAEDALANGVNPGDPAVIETTVRPPTAEEWIVVGVGRAVQSGR
jgi:hypothetical protein